MRQRGLPGAAFSAIITLSHRPGTLPTRAATTRRRVAGYRSVLGRTSQAIPGEMHEDYEGADDVAAHWIAAE